MELPVWLNLLCRLLVPSGFGRLAGVGAVQAKCGFWVVLCLRPPWWGTEAGLGQSGGQYFGSATLDVTLAGWLGLALEWAWAGRSPRGTQIVVSPWYL